MRINASLFLIPYLLIIALLSIFTFFLYPHVAKAADPVFASDDFNACSLNTGLWTFTDPLSDATVEATGYHVEISVPAGTSHDPWIVNNAARIMQPADNTDFEIEVKFDSALNDALQEQGIFVEEDSNRFLRFDFYSDGSNTKIFAASFSGGSGLIRINSVITDTNVAPMWLRVKRAGDQWTESYSFDGLNWTPSGTFTYALTVNSVGVFAGNDGDPESSTPAHTAQVDYFFNTASPITPEDANPVYTLNVTTVGNGAVEKDPDQSVYCGEEVELTAVPALSESFNGWGGDLTGSTNPITLTMTSDHAVTATFTADAVYTLSVTTAGSGTVTVDPIQSEYNYGQVVTLTATPDSGWGFTGWSGDLIGNTTPTTLTMASDRDVTATFIESIPPVIDIWYGSEQSFGQIGTPQEWVNILGNVTDTDSIDSLVYALNGGAESPLSIGPDNRRLANAGDFNIDIARTDLNNGSNQVVITATDTLNNQSVETVTVNYTDANSWPLPYTIDWSSVSNIQDVAQIVDGKWTIGADGLRVVEPWYDRLVAIGDLTWTDYEITVPITIHNLDSTVGPFSGDSRGVGVLMRWTGHSDNPVAGWQPKTGWNPNGAIGWWYWTPSDSTSARLEFWSTGINKDFTPVLETPYMLKVRVESTPGLGGLYKMKAWELGQSEPVNWDVTYQAGAGALANGSLMLIAHHVDASFGDVSVTPLSEITSTLTVTTIGNGAVTVDPVQADYTYGQVVTLTAAADPGWYFEGWDGDLSGNATSETLTMTDNRVVTATFTELISHTLTVTTVGSGTVTVEPDQSEYLYGSVITLTAQADAGWDFDGWSGDLSSSEMTQTLTITGDLAVTATFVDSSSSESIILSDDFDACSLDTSVWTFFNPLSDATMTTNGTQISISVPAGTDHEVETTNTAPRIMQVANNVDFEVEVKFDSAVSAAIQEQGIIIEADSTNYLRFEFYSDGTSTYLYTANYTNGSKDQDQSTLITNGSPLYMRVKREGSVWTQFYSYDGTAWFVGKTLNRDMVVSAVGAYGGNYGSSSAPAHTAVIDYFYNTANRGAGDVSMLITNTVGSGSINLSNNTPYCGKTVTLTATSASGWTFDGWQGDLSGTNNPETLLIDGHKIVTATFNAEAYTLTIAKDGSGDGSVSKEPNQPSYTYGNVVTLTATVGTSSTFAGWSDGLLGTTNPVTVTITGDKTITATFNLIGSGEGNFSVFLPIIIKSE